MRLPLGAGPPERCLPLPTVAFLSSFRHLLYFCLTISKTVRNQISSFTPVSVCSSRGEEGIMSSHAESGYNETEVSDIIIMNGTTSKRKRNGIVYTILNSFRKPEKEMLISIPTNVWRRGTSSRLPLVHVPSVDDEGLDNGLDEKGDEKRTHGAERKSHALISGSCYCVCSCSMILLNKVVLSTYGFDAGVSLMLYQNLVAVIIILILSAFGVVTTEKLTWRLVRVWVPVNMIFIGMLITGMYSLKYINVAMVTILKNVTNILTAIGDTYIFRRHQNAKVWAALFFMLTLRRVMDVAKQATRSGSLNEVSMVLLNNLLSLPFAIFLIISFNEWEYVYSLDMIRLPMFWVVATASGFLGLGISFTSMWFLHQTGPTTFSLVGSLNKIPLSVAGILGNLLSV
ncbi:GDP-mannose transporter [Nymphaea thermarum]|nr:GDP-mannose transporter [Nymphaea thermarum]